MSHPPYGMHESIRVPALSCVQGGLLFFADKFKDKDTVRQAIGVGQDLGPVVMFPIGYPAKEPKVRGRRSLDDLVHYR